MQHRRQPILGLPLFMRLLRLPLLVLLSALPSVATGVPLGRGDVIAAINTGCAEGRFCVYHYDQQGTQLYQDRHDGFATGVAVDDRGRVIVSTDRYGSTPSAGLLSYEASVGMATLNPSFSGSIHPNAYGMILGRSGDTISRFDSATDTFTPVFDLSTSTTLAGVAIGGFDVLTDGTILMVSADSVYRLDVGASDATLLASGGMLVAGPGLYGQEVPGWTARDIAVTRDQRILVSTFTHSPCAGCFGDRVRVVEIAADTGAQSEALMGAAANFTGDDGFAFPMAVGPDGRVYVGRGALHTFGDLTGEIVLLHPDGSATDFVARYGALDELAVSFVPEPSTALLTGLGLVGLTVVRRGCRARRD